MGRTKILSATLCFALLTVVGRGAPKSIPSPPPPPIVYEVSTSGEDPDKLLKVFNAVRNSVGGTLTKAEFLRRLKSREHFEIKFPETCRRCNGWRRLIPPNGKRGSDGKVNCKTCRGRGLEVRNYIVTWKKGVSTHLGDQRNPMLAKLTQELGDKASAHVWFSTARRYHTGVSSQGENARAYAHAAYEQAVAKANAAWRRDQPANSDSNRLHRHIIDEGLEGIADTVPQRAPKAEAPKPAPAEAETPE